MDEARENTNSQDSSRPELGEATTFPLIVYFVLAMRPALKIGTPATLEALNFVCKPLIKARSETKLYPLSITFQQYLAHKEIGQFLTFNGRKSNWQFDFRLFFWP
jgi:hypothetical protein